MIETTIGPSPTLTTGDGGSRQAGLVVRKPSRGNWRGLSALHRMAWICVLLASLCASWFSYQAILVPQMNSFTPEWGDAQWIRPMHGLAPVAYFRYATGLSEVPGSAFLTIAASQTFKLYVNGQYIGTNYADFLQGIFPRAYIYDITSVLQPGANVFAVRVANVDEQAPVLKVNIGFSQGGVYYTRGSGSDWTATYQSSDVFPRYEKSVKDWTRTDFDASSWSNVTSGIAMPYAPMLTANPQLYTYPTAQQWISAGLNHDAYFVRQFSVPPGISGAWLRVAATGIADIYINGQQFIVWNGQADVPVQTLSDYLGDSQNALPEYRTGLVMGMYNIGTYLHPGVNTIAVHVMSPGSSAAQVGLDNLSAALSLDMLIDNVQGQALWLTSPVGWHAASTAIPGWQRGNSLSLAWHSPFPTQRPGAVKTFYLPDNVTVRDQQILPIPLTVFVVLVSVGTVIGLWFLMALGVRRYYRSFIHALEVMSLSYLPAIALLTLLAALSREPQIAQPFPYTWGWACVLLALIAGSYVALWFYARKAQRAAAVGESNGRAILHRIAPLRTGLLNLYQDTSAMLAAPRQWSAYATIRWRIFGWLREYWPLLLLVLIAAPMVLYNLSYEPYWQDELSSYYVSRSILSNGLSFFPSGFYYPKAELFSYCIALWTILFGGQQGTLRLLSACEYLLSLPLIYRVGCKFFDKRVALLAAAMLAFSPVALLWGRQMRMYEQAQLMTLLTAFLFYKALQERKKSYLIYLAAASLVVDYLSHEEIFIILPALLLCILLVSKERKRLLPSVLYQKHWWLAALGCVCVIGAQLLIAKYSHPPLLGTDSSQQPFVQLTTSNVPFYVELLYFPQALGHGTYPFIAVNSLLATIGCIIVWRTGSKAAKYCAALLAGSMLTLVFFFTMRADRYMYPVLPFYYLMAAYALVVMLREVAHFAGAYTHLDARQRGSNELANASSGRILSRPMRLGMFLTVSLVCVSVLIVPMLPLSSYNLFVSRGVGFSYHRHYPDYDAVGQYMQQHMQKGDVVIAVAPAVSVLYYVGHVDYYFSLDRALFVFERHGQVVETTSGAQPLFNQSDLQAVLSKYQRIWIVSDNGSYQAAMFRRFSFPPDFHMVFEGYGSALYFRGN